MEIILRVTKQRVKKPVNKDWFWYDHHTKQRLYGKGGRMVFVYDKQNKQMVPRVVDAEEWVYEPNYDNILKWIKDNDIQILDQVNGHHVTIEVQAIQWSDLEEDLYRQKIQYDFDNTQYQKESGEKKLWQNSSAKWSIRLPH